MGGGDIRMQSNMRVSVGTVGVFLFLTLPLLAQVGNGIRAIVNRSIVTDFQVYMSAGSAIELLRSRYAGQPEEFQKQARQTLQNALDQLIERRLIVDEFERLQYYIPDAIVEEALRARIRDAYGGDRAAMIKSLQAQGLTLERFRQQIKEQLVVSAMMQKYVGSLVIVSPQKVLKYYESNKDQFRLEERIKLRMIMLDRTVHENPAECMRIATEIVNNLQAGESFSHLASIYNTPGLRIRKGDWGWAQRSELMAGLADVAFSLESGEWSPIIGFAKEEGGYWVFLYNARGDLTLARHYVVESDSKKEIIKGEYGPNSIPETAPKLPEVVYLVLVEEKQQAGYKPLEEVQAQIEQTLIVEERARLQKRWVDKLRARSFVRYF